MFTRTHNKEEVKLWRMIFDLRETIAKMSEQLDRYAIRQNKVINMHQPHGGNKNKHQTYGLPYEANKHKCVTCNQPYPCQTINALKK